MFKSNPSALRVAIVIFAVLFLGAGAVAVRNSQSPQAPSSTDQQDIDITPIPAEQKALSVLYATTDASVTKIWQVDIVSKEIGLFANLPEKIKHVNYVFPSSLIFIDEIDSRDHGKYIKKFDIESQTVETIATAAAGWAIDDVVVSPDATYIAWWEVIPSAEEEILLGGYSRVYVKKIGETAAFLVADEKALESTPIHYPMFFDGDNRLYLDSFIPNGGGYYLGMYVFNPLSSSSIVPVAGMGNGDFVSDPLLSPDGKKIVFTAYDKNAPVQVPSPDGSGINRQAVLNPNQIIVMDLADNSKTILLDSGNNAQYAVPIWSDDGLSIVYQKFTLIASDNSRYDGVYQAKLKGDVVPLEVGNEPAISLLSFPNHQLIWGNETTYMGNLGKEYANILSFIATTNVASKNTEEIVNLPAVQYLGITTADLPVLTTLNPNSVKLSSFTLNAVSERRSVQQNDETPQIAEKRIGREAPPVRCIREACGAFPSAACRKESKCYDSPLYLYPDEETEVTVKIPDIKIFSDTPQQKNNTWQVTAYPDGKIISNGQEYQNISYSYFSGAQVAAPTRGLVVDSHDLSATLEYFAQNLGLKDREVTDFVSFWQDYLPRRSFGEGGFTSPEGRFYFISFYKKEEAQRILPLAIDPVPDTLLQIVMYFKPLSLPLNVLPPVFEDVPPRTGFTAVDWSGIIDPMPGMY